MKEEIKDNVIRLKEEGKSYKEIRSITGLKEGTIKSIYSRRNVATKVVTCCKWCGKELMQSKGHRQKSFCSSKCKDSYWNSVRRGGQND